LHNGKNNKPKISPIALFKQASIIANNGGNRSSLLLTEVGDETPKQSELAQQSQVLQSEIMRHYRRKKSAVPPFYYYKQRNKKIMGYLMDQSKQKDHLEIKGDMDEFYGDMPAAKSTEEQLKLH